MGLEIERRRLSIFEELSGYEKSTVKPGGLLIKQTTVRGVRRMTTIDPKDHANFDRLAGWWAPNSSMALLYEYNYLRVQFIRDRLGPRLQNCSVLDVGCGAGMLAESLARLGSRQVTGVDSSLTSIEQARAHCPSDLKISYHHGELSSVSESFDVITAMEVIEHVSSRTLFLEQVRQRLKPGGLLFMSTIEPTLCAFASTILAAEYVLGVVPKGTHQLSKYVAQQTLAQEWGTAGI
ncbi:ubiquinone biosynthesis O-methyltransferase-like [Hippocampus zosterae]|uniref:ubiquinone biosynthesis O-methyltransferase-like n=1 Tax=Hippocampus zosterae TaxID=109293 RepID=UPI00223E6771|nr:ubiquinone biosynthesis O-methyltransferase-like [Hippocampus zosterae]